MSPMDSHDESLMVYADYLEEHGDQEKADEIRSSLDSGPELSWQYEYRVGGVGVGGVGVVVGVGGGGVGGVGGVVGVGGGGVGGVGVG
jgi:hypothetical protein